MISINKFKIIILLLIPTRIIYSQISEIDLFLGSETQSEVIEIWSNSGASPFNNENLMYIEEIIDVSKPPYNIEPGGIVGGQIVNLLNDLNPSSLAEQTIVYFPAGLYIIGNALNIPSFVILKGVCGDSDVPEHTTFQFAFNEPHLVPSNLISMSGQYSAIEDISLHDLGPDTNDDNAGDMIEISGSNCWVRGVESRYTSRFHVNIYGSNNTVSGCNFHHAHTYGGGGNAYGVCLNGTAYANRVEDNMFHHLRHSITLQYNPSYNVIAYNYSRDRDNNNLADLVFHGRHDASYGPTFNLCEGNIIEFIKFDEWHGENGAYNAFMRCYSYINGIKITKKHAWDDQYRQNIIGTRAVPQGDTYDLIDFCGNHEFWYTHPDWDDIPSEDASFYQESEPPEFYDNQVSWLNWPFLPGNHYGDLIPAKYRYDRNDGQYLDEPPTTKVVYAGWDIYEICGPPNLYFTDGSVVSNLNEEYLAMNEIIIGPYTFLSENNVSFKAQERITLLPDFHINAINENVLHLKAGNPCNNSKSYSGLNLNNGLTYEKNSFKNQDRTVSNTIIESNYNVRSITERNPNLSEISIAPNPNNGVFNIFFKHLVQNTSVSIYDINGSLIFIKENISQNDFSIDISNEQQGLYLIKITSSDINYFYKIVIN